MIGRRPRPDAAGSGVPAEQQQALGALGPDRQFVEIARLAGFQQWAAQRGLPSGKSGQCLANQGEIERLVQMVSEASTQYTIEGTPTFVLHGEVVPIEVGTPTWDQLEAAIKKAL